jgi:hypothetical protein
MARRNRALADHDFELYRNTISSFKETRLRALQKRDPELCRNTIPSFSGSRFRAPGKRRRGFHISPKGIPHPVKGHLHPAKGYSTPRQRPGTSPVLTPRLRLCGTSHLINEQKGARHIALGLGTSPQVKRTIPFGCRLVHAWCTIFWSGTYQKNRSLHAPMRGAARSCLQMCHPPVQLVG